MRPCNYLIYIINKLVYNYKISESRLGLDKQNFAEILWWYFSVAFSVIIYRERKSVIENVRICTDSVITHFPYKS